MGTYVLSIDEVGRRNVIPEAVGAPHCGIGLASIIPSAPP